MQRVAIDQKQDPLQPAAPTISAARKTVASKRARAEAGAALESMMTEPIAIVGMGCRFPGGADNPRAYWQLLHEGRSGIREMPEERWPGAREYLPPHLLLGGYLDQVDAFDPEFFSIAPREAASIDPQQRLLLEVSWEALLDARMPPSSLSNTETGVFVAVYNSDYFRMQMREGSELTAYTGVGAAHSVAAGRLSFLLNLHGPCLAIDTACSSSLVATHLACQSLRRHECDQALVAGASLKLLPDEVRVFAEWGMLSSDGRAKTFDSAADGFVPGEGCGVLVLKRLGDAIAQGDPIRAVLRGSAVNHDGRSSVLTAPNGPAQEAVMRSALRDAQTTPDDISFIETHGTGTSLGDPIEVEALDAVYGLPSSSSRTGCVLGAVKTNLGHLEAAAGVAGLIKLVLALENRTIPRNLNFNRLNPQIRLRTGSRLSLANQPCSWPRGPQPRFAAVSSFGLGGTNAHVILEEAPLLPQTAALRSPGSEPPAYCLPISAHSLAGLQSLAADWVRLLREPGADLASLARAAARAHDHQPFRLAVAGTSATDVASILDEKLAALNPGSCLPVEQTAKVAFVFSGQGSAWPGMLAALLDIPQAERTFDLCEALVQKNAGWSLRKTAADPNQIQDTAKAQPLLFAMQISLVKALEAWGIVPAAATGHSVGEIAAAVTAGVLTLEQGMRLALKRGSHMGCTGSPHGSNPAGRMLSAEISFAEAEALLSEIPKTSGIPEIAAINAPRSVVFAGLTAEVEALASVLHSRRVTTRWVEVPYAFHSAAMESASHALRAEIEEETSSRSRPAIALISTVTGQPWQPSDGDAAYWARGIRQPVLFRQATEVLLPLCDAVVEIGPHPVLLRSVLATAAAAAPRQHPLITAACMRRGQSARATLTTTLAALYEVGVPMEWARIYPGTLNQVDLPPYPWQRERYPLPAPLNRAASPLALTIPSVEGALPTLRIDSPFLPGQLWQTILDPAATPWLTQHCWQEKPLFPFAGWLEIASQAAGAAAGGVPVAIRDFAVHRRLTPTPQPVAIQTFVTPERALTLAAQVDGGWQTFASGFWELGEPLPDSPSVPIADLIASAIERVQPDALYADLSRSGLTYGPAFRLLAEVYRGTDYALAEIAAPTVQQYHGLAPTLLDACLQTLQATVPDALSGRAVLPMSVGQYRILSHSPVQFALARTHPSGEEGYEADLVLADSNGLPVAEINSLRVRAVPVEQLPAPIWSIAWHSIEPETTPLEPSNSALWTLASAEEPANHGSRLLQSIADALGKQAAFLSAPGVSPRYPFPALTPAANVLLSGDFASMSDVLLRLVAHEQALPGSIARICLITRAAVAVATGETVDPEQTALLGLLRTLRAEYPALAVHQLDLPAADADVLEFDLPAAHLSPIAASESTQVARWLRSLPAGKFSARSTETALRHRNFLQPHVEAGLSPSRHIDDSAWIIQSPGRLETLRPESSPTPDPAADEVQIAPLAHGLNFRDVLTALGTYAGASAPLGAECAGVVIKTGSQASRCADLAPGTLVMALAPGSLRTTVNVPAAYVVPLPPAMTLAQAATIPVAFLTAHYAFSRLASLQAGQTVLIHSAAGGLGQAAVQLAHAAGATVLATAGSPAKRAYLQAQGIAHAFDSRAAHFAEEVLHVTEGRGVDVVLNSLSGDRIAASFRALATGGAFLEVGKLGIWTPDQARAARPDARYWAFDLGEVASQNPSLIAEMFSELTPAFSSGMIIPLPLEVFPIADAVSAFRTMASGQHIGKLVLTQPPRPISPELWKSSLRDGAVLITGGTGALGVATARWLLEQGARFLVLLSRSGTSPAAQQLLADAAQSDVRVKLVSCDVADRKTVSTVLEQVRKSSPLTVIIHAAGETDDHLLSDLDASTLARGMRTKVDGARMLDELTTHDPLLTTVYYSSAASQFGSAGQASYAAANAFLDGLAAQRTARGLTTLSVNWGAWANGGMADQLSPASQSRLRRQGAHPMVPAAALAALGQAIFSGQSRLTITDLDWQQYLNQFPHGSPAQAFFAGFMPAASSPAFAAPSQPSVPVLTSSKDAQTIAAIHSAARAERTPLMEAYVRSSARSVLGLSAGRPMPGDTPLQEFGLDSLMALELRNVLAHALNRPLSATLLFDHPTIRGLAQHLLTLVFQEPAETEPYPTVPAATPDEFIDLSQISEAEAEELLLAELDRKGRP